MRFSLPRNVRLIAKTIASHGYKAYLVGGAVRDLYRKKNPGDYDFATNAPIEEIQQIFRRTIPTGIEHGTISVLIGKDRFEITRFRTDGIYSDARHPDCVHFTEDITADLSRRDFTINAIAYDIDTDKINDPFNGRLDIDRGCIRCIGNAQDRLREDPLRILRGFRFASQLGFNIDHNTLKAMHHLSDQLCNVSIERIRDEFSKTICGIQAANALELMNDNQVLQHIIPELTACKGIEQKGYHQFDVFDHCLYAAEHAPRTNLPLILAALLHDIGKAETMQIQNGEIHFHNHEQAGAKKALKILKRLKYPNTVVRDVCHLIQQHMFNYTPEWSDAAVRRFIYRVGEEYLEQLFILRRCDEYAFARKAIDSVMLQELIARTRGILSDKNALKLKDLKVNGTILHEKLDIPRDRQMGIILSELLDTVLDDPDMNNESDLLQIADRLYRKITE